MLNHLIRPYGDHLIIKQADHCPGEEHFYFNFQCTDHIITLCLSLGGHLSVLPSFVLWKKHEIGWKST